ncbi:MAG TPA: ribosome biogenesis GTPase Der [Candidatus Saccharimonadales bacterium]|nr:ribosome biogenesis GTPase Der [Candidatus Saccharimonadales bacterium]
MSKKLPIVAIVGRANVGKSSLFNAILDRRETIVAREAGTTRDSITAKAEFNGQNFWLVDTAGIKDPDDEFEFTIQEQIIQAADSADVIWVVVEADVPITEEDRRVARLALRSRKPVFLVVNKLDRAKGADLTVFVKLGIKDMVYTSATQTRGITELLDKLLLVVPHAILDDADDRLKIALVGRPNVGKSSLFNALAKKQQAIVADLAGTTRDVNRTSVRYKGREIELLDTAGIRRNGKIKVGIERFSVIRALSAIEQADIALLLMDVNELNVLLDQKIAGMIKDAGKGLILVVSKWDSAEGKDAYTRDALAPGIAANFEFVPWAPLIFTSSQTGQNVTKLFDLALAIDVERKKRLTTSTLNRWLRSAVEGHPPAGLKNRTPKLNYIVQETDNPTPAFKIFGSSTRFLHWSYKRYLESRLREEFGYEGTPVQLWFIEKHIAHKHGVSPTKEMG